MLKRRSSLIIGISQVSLVLLLAGCGSAATKEVGSSDQKDSAPSPKAAAFATDRVSFSSLEEMVAASEVVVVAKVVEVGRGAYIGKEPGRLQLRDVALRVSEILRGNAGKENLKFVETGWGSKGAELVIEGYPTSVVGQEGIYFLGPKVPDGSPSAGSHSLLNSQGRFFRTGGKDELKPGNKENGLSKQLAARGFNKLVEDIRKAP